jgi:hypothetical protein
MTRELSQGYKAKLIGWGNYYGYPQCCIDSFTNLFDPKTRSEEQEKVHWDSGFIPCREHALEILAGKTTLEALILPTRQHPRPFKTEKPALRVTKQK